MRIGLDVLRRWVDLPEDPHQVRILLDECGLEVKRVERDAVGPCFTLELLANRGDHHCYEGLSRELYGRLGTKLHRPDVSALATGLSPVELRIETELCLRYTATLLTRTGTGSLSPEALRVLAASGQGSVSPPVDASNVANLELGQPTHAFDADQIEGAVVVRLSRPGERAWPLFQPEPVEVPAGTLVIADDRKILGIAGVIGCEESKTTDRTTRLLLESATFDPVAVRKASRAMRITTDASARFERGADPARPLIGAGRVADLLASAGWKVAGPSGVAGSWVDPRRSLPLDPAAANRFLAVELSPSDQAERLSRYGFTARGGAVDVPTWRLWDVEFTADLYEELAKSLGYDNTPEALPPIALGAEPSPAEARRARAEEVLLGNGFYEVYTDGFYGRDVFALLGLAEGDPLYAHVQTTNALDRGYALLKNNALHQAITAVGINERRRTTDVKMFEWTRTFHPTPIGGADRGDRRAPPCTERHLLWMVAAGRDRSPGWEDHSRAADPTYLSGVLGELGVELGLRFTLDRDAVRGDPLAQALHPGRSAAILRDGVKVGVIGEVHPAVCRRYKLKTARPCYLELDASAILAAGERPRYVEPPATQDLVRNLAFALPRGLDAGEIVRTALELGPDWLDRVSIVDRFVLPESDGVFRSVTFELHYANPEAARTAEEVNAATGALVGALLDRFGARGVTQR